MNIKPLFDRVLCRQTADQTSQGGIYIPTTSAERSQILEVVAVGAASPVTVGDKIIINKYSAAEVSYHNSKLYLVQNLDIIGVIEDE